MTILRDYIPPLFVNGAGVAGGVYGFVVQNAPILELMPLLAPTTINLVSTIFAIGMRCLVENKKISAKTGLVATAVSSVVALLVTMVVSTFLSVTPLLLIAGMVISLISGIVNCGAAYEFWLIAQITFRNKYAERVLEEIRVVDHQSSEKQSQVEEGLGTLLSDMDHSRSTRKTDV